MNFSILAPPDFDTDGCFVIVVIQSADVFLTHFFLNYHSDVFVEMNPFVAPLLLRFSDHATFWLLLIVFKAFYTLLLFFACGIALKKSARSRFAWGALVVTAVAHLFLASGYYTLWRYIFFLS